MYNTHAEPRLGHPAGERPLVAGGVVHLHGGAHVGAHPAAERVEVAAPRRQPELAARLLHRRYVGPLVSLPTAVNHT